MKRAIQVILVALALFTAIPAHAQFQWGLKGGVNLSNTSLKDTDFLKGESYTGFFIGPMVEFTVPVVGLGVDGSLLYSLRGAKLEGTDSNAKEIKGTLKQHALEVPINLKYSFGLGNLAAIFIAAGPQFGFDLKSDDTADFMNKVVDNTTGQNNTDMVQEGENFFKKTNFSINVGLGAKLLNHLQLGVNYNIPLGKTAEYDGILNTAEKAFSAKVKTWQISLAYLF